MKGRSDPPHSPRAINGIWVALSVPSFEGVRVTANEPDARGRELQEGTR